MGTVGSQRLYVTVALAKEVTLLDFRHNPDTNSTLLQPIHTQTTVSLSDRLEVRETIKSNLQCNEL